MVCMTLNCVRLTQSSVIQIIHHNVGLKCFFHLPINFCYYQSFLLTFVSQGSVEMHLLCGGIYNNHIIANYLQSVPVKEF